VAYGLYGLGNFAPTLLVLRATDLLHPGRTLTSAAALAVLLYTIHNAANAVAAYPAGAVSDRIGHRSVLAAGFALFGLACVGFAVWEPVKDTSGPFSTPTSSWIAPPPLQG